MRLIAFRPEYQITAEPSRNRIFYKHFAETEQPADLPHYLADWQQALDAMQPGFTILSDMTELLQASNPLVRLFEQVQQLLPGRGLRLIATVHAPGNHHPHEASSDALPRRIFTDLWEADNYLDELDVESEG